MSRPQPIPGRFEAESELAALPRLQLDDPFPFVCAGCGSCCRARRDIVMSGLDLYRLARRLRLPPATVAEAFCRQTAGLLPGFCLKSSRHSGNCPFFEANACTVHEARPLACALYPLGQAIDLDTGRAEYYLQPPLCGARAGESTRTLRTYLADSGILERAGADVFWARSCARLADRLIAVQESRRLPAIRRRILRALYLDYDIRDDFAPQFVQNISRVNQLLDRLMPGWPSFYI